MPKRVLKRIPKAKRSRKVSRKSRKVSRKTRRVSKKVQKGGHLFKYDLADAFRFPLYL